jgi:hypothetical protein
MSKPDAETVTTANYVYVVLIEAAIIVALFVFGRMFS